MRLKDTRRAVFVCLLLVAAMATFGGILGCAKAKHGTTPMPEFSFFRLAMQGDSATAFHRADLPTGVAVLMMFFNSDCDHCQREAQKLVATRNRWENVAKIVMVSVENARTLARFDSTYHLTEAHITLLRDPEKKAGALFGVSDIPYAITYDHEHRRLRAFKGEVAIDTLLQSFQ